MSSTEFEISGDIYKVNGKKVTVREYCKVAGEQINKLQSQLIAALAKKEKPASEPDTRESREAEIDKDRHHGY